MSFFCAVAQNTGRGKREWRALKPGERLRAGRRKIIVHCGGTGTPESAIKALNSLSAEDKRFLEGKD